MKDINLIGTEWPGGLPPSYQDNFEENSVVSVQDILLSDKLVYSLKAFRHGESQVQGAQTPPNPEPGEEFRTHISTLSSRSIFASLSRIIKEWARSTSDSGRSTLAPTPQGIELNAGVIVSVLTFIIAVC